MPLFYQYNITENTKLAVWHILEDEKFFLQKVSVQREITHPHKRLQHLAGRFLLMHVFPDFPHHLIEIAETRKPFLADEAFHFSISHCADFAAVIVSKNMRVGIDVELVTPKVERVKHKFLYDEERMKLSRSGFSLLKQLTIIWSAKEAVFKWYGAGEIDFREDIHLLDPVDGDEGTVRCQFRNNGTTDLDISFKTFDQEICLAWVSSEI